MTTSRSATTGSIGKNRTRLDRGANGIAELGLVSDIGVRRAIEHLPTILHQGEKVCCAASGFLEGRSGLVAATSQRLLFVYKNETPVDVRYSEISKFRAKAGIVAAELVVEDDVGRAVIKQIHPRARLVEFAALLNDPSAAESMVSDECGRAQASADQTWRPKLRPKVSPLPARPSDPPSKTPVGPAIAKVRLAVPQSRSNHPFVAGSWKPRFADPHVENKDMGLSPQGDSVRPSPLGKRHRAASIPGGDSWVAPGEWLMATFTNVLLVGSDHESSTPGEVSITNRRLLFFPSGDDALELSVNVTADLPASSTPNRIGLSDGSALDFPDATTAREFSASVQAAADLARSSALRSGEEVR